MTLKHDCVRETLLYLEKNLTFDTPIYSPNIQIKNFSSKDINYTIAKLKEAGYINTEFDRGNNITNYYIQSITWNGHQFLDNIRDSKVWTLTQKIISGLSSVSITMIENIAAQVITNLIKINM